jgi:hypothetical protein
LFGIKTSFKRHPSFSGEEKDSCFNEEDNNSCFLGKRITAVPAGKTRKIVMVEKTQIP